MKWPIPSWLQTIWKDEKQRANLLMGIGVTGMLLLAVSEFFPTDAPSPAAEQTTSEPVMAIDAVSYAQSLEDRLQALLCQVEGAGMVQVMVTLSNTEETIYAQDRQIAADGASHQSHILLNGDPPALVETIAMPAIQGVAVLCEGAGSAVVQNRITQIVDVLTGVGTSHITVTQMVTPNQGG